MSEIALQLDQLQRDIQRMYADEHATLGRAGGLALLERGQQWHLAPTLLAGGALIFPHAGVADCGHQIAACVSAALDSGADTVLVVSVLHAFTDEMEQARRRVAAGEPPAAFRHWGIQGPGLARGDEWRGDHALMSWRFFWQLECERRGLGSHAPRVIERYPYLAGGHPEELPGIEELAALAKDAAIVSTADPFHHGLGYGTLPELARAPHDGGIELARASLARGIALLEAADDAGYNAHCVSDKSDHRDAGQVLRLLVGPHCGTVHDVAISDAAALYASPPPTWVAGALIAMDPTPA